MLNVPNATPGYWNPETHYTSGIGDMELLEVLKKYQVEVSGVS